MLDKLREHKATLIGMEDFRKYAVVIPLIATPDGYEVLFEVRSEKIGRQPGDICFPGGKMEAGEEPEQAAVRESAEELLIRPDQLELLGLMDVFLTEYGNLVYPYAAILRDYEGTYSEDEVAEVFTVPLKFFLETEPEEFFAKVGSEPEENFPFDRIHGGRDYPWRKSRRAIYFYSYEGREIWGMTARIMKAFVRILRNLDN